MGDRSTHAIRWQGYWYLVYAQDKQWIYNNVGTMLCNVGEEDRKVSLEDPQ